MSRFVRFILVLSLVAAMAPLTDAATAVSLHPDDWNLYSCRSQNGDMQPDGAIMQQTADGLQFFGAGSRRGTAVFSKSEFNLQDGSVRYQWMADGGSSNQFMAVFVGVGWWEDSTSNCRPIAVQYFTTNHSWNGSTVVADDVWYFSRLTITPDQQYTLVTATGDYDDRGGTLFHTESNAIRDYSPDFDSWEQLTHANVYSQLWDNYGGTTSSMTLGEVEVDSIPEPSSLCMMIWAGVSALGLISSRRRAKTRKLRV